MVKRLSLLGFCILGLLLPTSSQQGPAVIEYLTLATTGGSSIPWELRPDPTVQRTFESPILLSFDVPPSPKSPAVFLEVWAQFMINWTSNPVRICNPVINWRLISPAIPNIEFTQGYGVASIHETNYAGDHSYPTDNIHRYKGSTKMPLRRDVLEWWNIWDKSKGQWVPYDVALTYVSTLIDNGFRVEVWASGTIQGLSYIAPFAFQVEVTRLSNKK
jgi:hypothetical protein